MPKRFWRSLLALAKFGLVLGVLKVILGAVNELVGINHHDGWQWLLNGVWVIVVCLFAWRAYVGLYKEGHWWIEEHDGRRR